MILKFIVETWACKTKTLLLWFPIKMFTSKALLTYKWNLWKDWKNPFSLSKLLFVICLPSNVTFYTRNIGKAYLVVFNIELHITYTTPHLANHFLKRFFFTEPWLKKNLLYIHIWSIIPFIRRTGENSR